MATKEDRKSLDLSDFRPAVTIATVVSGTCVAAHDNAATWMIMFATAIASLLAVLERRGCLAAVGLSGMNQVERRAAMKIAIEKATRTPEGQTELMEALRKAA
jgi:hypothetical protein